MKPDPSARSARSKLVLIETIALAVVCLAALWSSWTVLRPLGNKCDVRMGVVMFSLRAPVMFAAGKGMRNIDLTAFPPLGDFYGLRAETFDVADIPPDYRGFALDSYQLMHYFLMCSIGWAWRILGVSHWALNVVAAVLYVVFLLAVYGLFRTVMGRLLSAGLAVWLAFAPPFLLICPSIRDFSTGPFMLLALFVLAHLSSRQQSARSFRLSSVGLGIIVGIGFGFRQDVGLTVPFALAVFFLIIPVKAERPTRVRLAAAAFFLITFVVAGWMPIRGTLLDKGSASAQAFVQGVSEDAEKQMDFGHASYTQHHSYSDWLDFAIVVAHARRLGYTTPIVSHFTPEHGEAGQRLVKDYWRMFPGDMFGRALTFLWLLPQIPAMVTPQMAFNSQPGTEIVKERLWWHEGFSHFMARWGWPAILLALALLYVSNPRLGLFFSMAVLFLGIYPSTLFEYRHFFYIAFLPYWAAGVVATQLPNLTRRLVREPGFLRMGLKRLGMFSAMVMGVIATLLCLQFATRAWQAAKLDRFGKELCSTTLEPWSYTTAGQTGGSLIQPTPCLPELEKTGNLPPYEVAQEYIALEFKDVRGPLPLKLVYEHNPNYDFSRNVVLPRALFDDAGAGFFFFPVFELIWPNMPTPDRGRFLGIELSTEALHSFSGLWRVPAACSFHLWPFIMIPKDGHCLAPWKTGPIDRTAEWLLAKARSAILHDSTAMARLYLHWLELLPERLQYLPMAEKAIQELPPSPERTKLLDNLNELVPGRASQTPLGR